MLKKLGRRWKKLHQLTYLIVALGVLHFLWLVKADYLEPGIYALIAVILLLHRLKLKKWLSLKTSVQSS
jgi:sulfoxide reductase heme-binding subunit YedZ